ncbi:MAG: cellulase family glycosylhydrolase [Solirubrobacteraceae bacterium]
MRRLLPVLILLALAAPAAAAPQLPLGHAGRWITDARGRVVILQGINMVYKRAPYAPDATGFGEDDARFLAAEGFDTVRVGVIYKALEPEPGVYDDAYLTRIVKTVNTLGRHGIVSLVDFHQDMYNERFQGEGWPDWAVYDDGLPAEPKRGFSTNYLVMPALQRAYDNFFDDVAGPGGVGLQERYVAAFAHVAERFRRNDNVLGYDLMNEPWPGAVWQDCINPAGCPANDAKLAAFSAKAIAAIRTADTRHLVFYEPWVLFNFGGGTSIGPFGDKKLAMSFHSYCLSAGSSDSNAGCDATDDLVADHADAHAERTGDALLLTEFGATQNDDILTAMVNRYERHMIGWQEWHYCGCDDPTTTGSGDKQAIVLDPAKPPRGANLRAPTLKILSRPHPRAVAGTPEGYDFDDATGAFTLRWTPARASGKGRFAARAVTEVALPRRQYPKGYAVKATGARVLSKRGAPVLRLAARTGAAAAQVVVTPRR